MGYLTINEPFTNLLTQGMVIKDGTKMSKSKGNVVDPSTLIERYGADTVRLFSLFAAPPQRDLEWSDKGVEGASRFLTRVHRFIANNIDILTNDEVLSEQNKADRDLHRKTHQTIQKFTNDLDTDFHFNTAISGVMELVNSLHTLTAEDAAERAGNAIIREAVETILLLMAPMVPHFCEELWELTGHNQPLHLTPWPSFDAEAAKEDELTIVVQVNGKVRGRLTVAPGIDEEELKKLAHSDEKVVKFIEGKEIRKTIVIKNKLINIVV